MGRRMQRFVAEVTKFLTVGGVATMVAFVLFNALVHGYFAGPGPLNDQPILAFVIANTVGMLVSYRGSRSWAFRHRETVGAAGGRVLGGGNAPMDWNGHLVVAVWKSRQEGA